ncbi:MAG: hypothetical protein ACI4VQ_03755 [Clostridia bacterium]
MEYSKDIILGINYLETEEKGQANTSKGRKKITDFIKKHKLIATMSLFCGILMVLDCILVHNFIMLLQALV